MACGVVELGMEALLEGSPVAGARAAQQQGKLCKQGKQEPQQTQMQERESKRAARDEAEQDVLVGGEDVREDASVEEEPRGEEEEEDEGSAGGAGEAEEEARRGGSLAEGGAGLVKVFLRLRPHAKAEGGELEFGRAADDALLVLDEQTVQTVAPEDSQSFKNREAGGKFSFSRVFEKPTGQEVLFRETTYGLVESLVNEGRDGLLFAYGVTNAGKTFTVEGSESAPGLIPRALQQVFACLDARKQQQAAQQPQPQPQQAPRVEVSYLQVYNEEVHDLQGAVHSKSGSLVKERLKIKLRDDGVEVVGLRSTEIRSCKEGLGILARGRELRETHETHCNVASSRSHSVYCIQLVQPERAGDAEYKPPRLYIVDLAGSERGKRTLASKARQREASNINCSLMNLMRCLDTLRLNQKNKRLGKKDKMVPFRESKLTLLFRDCFVGANCGGVVMIVNASARPEDYDETAHALKYGAIVKEVQVTRMKTRRPSVGAVQYAANGRRLQQGQQGQQGAGQQPLATHGLPPQTPLRRSLAGAPPRYAAQQQLGLGGELGGELVDDDGHAETAMDDHPLVSALVYELADARLKCVTLEAEIRDEVAKEMAQRLEEMEKVFRKRVDAATSISNQKSEKLLGNLRKRMNESSSGKSNLYTIEDIEALVNNISECEEEMQKMRELHAADVASLQRQVETLARANASLAGGADAEAAAQQQQQQSRRKSREANRQSFEHLDRAVNDQLDTIARLREELVEERALHDKTVKQLESATLLAKDAQAGEADAERQVVALKIEVDQLRERLRKGGSLAALATTASIAQTAAAKDAALLPNAAPLPLPPKLDSSSGLLKISSPGAFFKAKKSTGPPGPSKLSKHASAPSFDGELARAERAPPAKASSLDEDSMPAAAHKENQADDANANATNLPAGPQQEGVSFKMPLANKFNDAQGGSFKSEPEQAKRGLVSRMVGRMRR